MHTDSLCVRVLLIRNKTSLMVLNEKLSGDCVKIILLLLAISSSQIFSQSDLDSTIQRGIKQIYNIEFEEAENTFRRIIADYPNHPSGRFFLAMIDWWRILLDLDNESRDDIFFEKLEDVIYQCDEILDDDPDNVDALFFKGGAIGFRGRLRAYRESWLKAADDGREALPIVQRSAELNPNNTDVQLGFGIYNYYAAVVPNDYPMLKPLMIFFPDGDKAKGIKQLEQTAENGKYAKYEAQYFLMTLYYQFENNPYKAEEYANKLTSEFPNNAVFQKWKGRAAAKKGDFSQASEIFKEVLGKAEDKVAGYNNSKTIREAAYYVGVQYRNINQLDSAKIYLEQSAEHSLKIDGKEESGFLINSYLYLGMINDVLGNRSKAKDYYKSLLSMREYGKSRELAEQYLDEPYKQ